MSPHDDMGGMSGYDWQTPRMLEAEDEVRRLRAQSLADEDLLREALHALRVNASWPFPKKREDAIAALRKRLGE